MVTAALLMESPPAGATPGQVAGPGSIQQVAQPGIALHVPADGRLNGYGFATDVTGYRFTGQVGAGDSTIRAATGQRLLVFGLRGSAASTASQSVGTPAPTALLDVDGAEQPLPTANLSVGSPVYYLASVPARSREVSVQLSSQGYTQTFSFTAGSRQLPAPTVLYRAKDAWQATDPLDQTVTVPTPDPAENLPDAALDVTVRSAILTWFGPRDPSQHPADPAHAWLVLDATSQPHQTQALAIGSQLNYLSTLPASAVTLTTPDAGQPIPATLTGQGGPADQSADQSGLFGGVYYWQVPADLTSATVTITTGTITAEDSWLGSPQTITVPGHLTFNLSFAAPYTPPTPPPSPPATADPSHPALASAPAHRSGGGFPLLSLLALPALALLGTAGLLARRRRPRTPPPPPSPGAPGPTPTAEHPAPERPVRPPAAPPPASQRPAEPNPTILADPPTQPVPPPPGTIRVDVQGPLGTSGWPAGQPAPGQTVLEVLCLLALHPDQRFTTEEIRTRLGIGRARALDPGTIRRYINELRRACGDQHIPETRAGEGYHTRAVTTDAAQTADLAAQAAAAATPVGQARLLAAALSLVRGAPFADAPPGAYGWADTDPSLGPAITANVVAAAEQLADVANHAGDARLAIWAAEKGLLVSPAEDVLYRHLLTAAATAGPSRLDTTWTQIKTRLARLDAAPSDDLSRHYRRLRNGDDGSE